MTKKLKKITTPKTSKNSKKTTALAINNHQKDMASIFAGSADLVKSGNEVEKTMVLKVAEAFGVPAICVGVQGGLPYINKDGLLFKLEEYHGAEIVSLTSKAVQYSLKKGERAIFETTLIIKTKNGERTFNAVGEADDDNVKLAAVKATPNLMAETRSQNRCIRRAIQAQMLADMFKNLGKSKIKPDEREIVETALSSSVEEMERPPVQSAPQARNQQPVRPVQAAQTKTPEDYVKKLEDGLTKRGLKSMADKKSYITKMAGLSAAYAYEQAFKKGMTPREAQAIIGQILKGEAEKK